MNQRRSIDYKKTKLPDWIAEQLAMGTMEVFFPVSFMQEENLVTAVFQTDGYRKLSQVPHLPTEEVFQIFGQLLQQMENNERHYLSPERYRISPDTLYIHPLKNKVKMIFVLNEEGVAAKEQLCELAVFCQSMVSEEGQSYLRSWAEELQNTGLSYRSAIHRCDMLQQEIYVCDIP